MKWLLPNVGVPQALKSPLVSTRTGVPILYENWGTQKHRKQPIQKKSLISTNSFRSLILNKSSITIVKFIKSDYSHMEYMGKYPRDLAFS